MQTDTPTPKPETPKRDTKRKTRSTAKRSPQVAKNAHKTQRKAAKGKASTKAAQPAKGGRKPLHPDDAIIRVLVKDNPKRPGSRAAADFARYRDGMTVKEFLQAGGSRAGLKWDSAHGFIRVEQPAKR